MSWFDRRLLTPLTCGLALSSAACGTSNDDSPSGDPNAAFTAELAWSKTLDQPAATTRIVAQNWLLNIDDIGNITSLDGNTGDVRWADEIDLQVPLTWAFWFDTILLPDGTGSVYFDVSQGTRNENAFATDPSFDQQEGVLLSSVGEDRISVNYYGWSPAWAQDCNPDCREFVVDGRTFTTAPTAIGDDLLAVTADALHRLLGTDNPEQRANAVWRVPLESNVDQAPIVVGDTVVAVDSSGSVAAIGADDGYLRWIHSTAALAGPAVSMGGARLLLVTTDGSVEALNIADGAVLWSTDLPGSAAGGAAVDGDEVFFATTAGDVLSLSGDDGSVQWTFAADGAALAGAPVVQGGKVIVGSVEGEVIAVTRP